MAIITYCGKAARLCLQCVNKQSSNKMSLADNDYKISLF